MAGKAGTRIGKLSARFVKTAKTPGLFGDGGGLYLKIDERAGAKSWIFRHQVAGRKRKLGLGALHTVSLADARKRAEDVRRQLLDGIDPRQARIAKQVALAGVKTFGEVATAYIEANKPGWKNAKHAKQWRSTLDAYASTIWRLPVAAVDTSAVMKLLQPIWAAKNETAHRVRGRVEAILAWATVHGYRSGTNPASWRGHLDQLLPARAKVHKVEHHAALPYAELPAFMRQLRKRYGIGPLALEFAILCASRTLETLNATWSEFDLNNKLWVIPGERMKGDREHRVPLSERAVAIVKEMRTIKRGEFVFPGAKRRKPLSNMALLTTLRRMDRGDLTAHGFRATFKTWASERTTVAREVIEAALAHAIESKTEAAYQRGDLLEKRRHLMDAWAAYCDSPRRPARQPPKLAVVA